MKRKILFFLLCLLPFMSYAQLQGTYSKYVGEYQDLEVSTAASQIYSIDWKKWSGDVECVTLIQNWGNDATVHIDEYFTGTIRIRAQYKTMSNAIKTEYFDIRCNAVTLSPSPSSISLSKVGETEFITYTKSPSNKFPTVEYSSSNPNVATVGFSSGLVTAIAKGSATITLKNSMGPDAKVSVSVAGGGGSSGGGDSGGGGSSDEDTYTQLTTEEGDLMWVCSTKLNNENVYVVEVPPFIASGFSCVAKSIAGKVTIPSGWGGRSVRKIKAYAFNYLSGITEVVIPSTLKYIENNSFAYCSSLKTITCYAVEPPTGSSLNHISTYDSETTLYVPSATAKAKYQNAPGWCNFKEIKVIGESDPIVPTSISVSPSTKTIEVGDGFYCSYTISPSDANSQTSVTWTSDDSSIASVSSSGYVTGKKAGKTYINATTANGKTAWCTVTVTSSTPSTIVPTSITVSPSSKTIEVGGGFYCSYTISPSNANSQTSVTWTSDDSSIASVSSSGYVTGKKAGKTYINATTANGQTSWCTVTVTSSGSSTIVPTSISVSPSTKTIEVGDGFYCSYTISPSNANSQTSVTWTSDDSSIASVSSSGYVTGKKVGSTYINATTANGKSDWCKVAVTSSESSTIVPTSISVSPSTKTIEVGDGFYCSYTISPSNANSETSVTWSSDDSSIATVSSSGYVTGKKAGSTYINAKTANGKTDWCKVTVTASQIPQIQIIKQIELGGYFSMILKTDGTLWACGENYDGQLGDGTTTDRKTPIKVMSDVAQVSAGYDHSMILKTDGTLWACGYNKYGQLGDGTTTDRTSFVKIAEPNITENEITVKMPDAGYATFYSAQSAYSLPRNLSAQVVTNASDNKLTYKTIADGSVSGVIPVGTPVMLVSDNKQAGTYTLTSTESKVSYSGTNLLRGSDEPTTSIGDGYHYKLSYGQSGSNLSNVFGWYWGAQNGAPFQIEGHKAWLVVPKSSSSTRGFAIGGEATGIEMVSGDDNVEADAVYYDLQGRRVTKPTVKGVYIKNGKKVMVK